MVELALYDIFSWIIGISGIILGGWILYIFIPFLGLIGALIGGVLSYRGVKDVSENQVKTDIKNIAKAIELDIQNVEKSPCFSSAYFLFTNSKSSLYCKANFGQPVIPYAPPIHFYNKETGLYFVYQKEISKLNFDLALKIYKFYDNLIVAENLRSFISQDHDFIIHDDGERIVKYNEMTKLVVECGKVIQELKDELEKVQNRR